MRVTCKDLYDLLSNIDGVQLLLRLSHVVRMEGNFPAKEVLIAEIDGRSQREALCLGKKDQMMVFSTGRGVGEVKMS